MIINECIIDKLWRVGYVAWVSLKAIPIAQHVALRGVKRVKLHVLSNIVRPRKVGRRLMNLAAIITGGTRKRYVRKQR